MSKQAPQGVTADDVLVSAKRLIVDFGWRRLSWPEYGPAPRCIRCAITCAAEDLDARATTAHTDALRRVSEAIYNHRGSVGGIIEWEFKKKTTSEDVVALLQKAIEMGPSDREYAAGVWPT